MGDMITSAKAQSINLVTKFTTDLHNLMEVLGKTDVEKVAAGTAVKIYKTSGTLKTAAVAPKAEIPDSNYTTDDGTFITIELAKYRNLTAIEEIAKKGYDLAVGKTNGKMLADIQKGIRKSIVLSVQPSGATKVTTNKTSFQAKIAKAVGKVVTLFEDEACTPIAFVNPEDAFDYLGDTAVTVQTMFGISYIKNFLGIATVILDSNVAAGSVHATAVENLNLVAAELDKIEGFDFETDETGLIAVYNGAKYENGSVQTVAFTGITVYPSVADRVVSCTYKA